MAKRLKQGLYRRKTIASFEHYIQGGEYCWVDLRINAEDVEIYYRNDQKERQGERVIIISSPKTPETLTQFGLVAAEVLPVDIFADWLEEYYPGTNEQLTTVCRFLRFWSQSKTKGMECRIR